MLFTALFFIAESASAQTGLVAAYSFNEGAGTTVADVSGNGNNGTISGASWSTTGKFGNALTFNGTSARVTVANSTSLKLASGMTLEAWVYPTQTPTGWRAVIGKNVDGYYLMASTDVGNRPGAGGTWTGGNQNTIAPSAIPVNTWTHLATTFDGATVRVFVNGVQVASQAQTTALAPTTGTLQIGGDSYPSEYFAGRIDEVRIYSRALSAAQIQADMTTPVGGAAAPDTSAPGTPTAFKATAVSASQVNLSWSAPTDNVGVTGYRVERCPNASCTTYSVIASPVGTTFGDTGLAAATTYRYRVLAIDAAGNKSAYATTMVATKAAGSAATLPTVTLTAPAAAAKLTGTVTISANATGTNIAGVQFMLDGASIGAEQPAPFSLKWNTTSTSNGTHSLSARVRDAAGNTANSTSVTVTVANTQANGGLVAAYTFNEGSGSTVADVSGNGNNGTIGGATWTTSGKFGNALVFNGSGAQVTVPNSTSLQLTSAMTLEAWVYPTTAPTGWRAVIDKNVDGYYLMASTNVGNQPGVGGTWVGGKQATIAPSVLAVNAWTHLATTFDGSMVRFFVNGVQVASQAQATQLAPTTGTLQIGGDSYASEFFAGRIDEVRIYNRALSAAEIQADANTAVGAAPSADTTAPSVTAGLGATSAGTSQINLAWTAATDNVGVTSYRVERCQGTGCTAFAQVSAPTTTSFNDTGLLPSTGYSYRVRAVDATGNLGAYSSVASAATLAVADTTAPSTPTSVTATAVSATQVNLAWTASTDNVGVTGYRIYRGGTLLATVGATTTYQSTGLTASSTYTYTVQAIDAAGNASIASTPASATTKTPSTATVLAWDAVAAANLSGYRLYYGTSPGVYQQAMGQGVNVGNVTTYTLAGLKSGTRYYFAVTAVDSANNESSFSNEAYKDIP
ncbi:MAG TPA: LamG-like jellyroll fold domain-containing protein [Burkholderiales bacterium]|nr:LamG-like jellyroll fold domain-containing protein [Burkholderiales bacterium]